MWPRATWGEDDDDWEEEEEEEEKEEEEEILCHQETTFINDSFEPTCKKGIFINH